MTKPTAQDLNDVSLRPFRPTKTKSPPHAHNQDVHQCGSSDKPAACHGSNDKNATTITIWSDDRKMMQW